MNGTLRPVWLILRMDLRVRLREWRGGSKSRWAMVALLVFVYLFLHLIAWPMVMMSREAGGPTMEALGWVLVGFIAISSAFANLRFERDDSALLLSSPLSPRTVLTARIVGQAIGSALPVLFLATPFFHLAILFKGVRYLACYPTALALAVLCASATYAGALTLSRWIGPKRVLGLVRIAGALLGVCFVLLGQLPGMLNKTSFARFAGQIPALPEWPGLAQFIRAGAGHSLDLLLVLGAAAGAMALVALTCGDVLLRGIQSAQETKPRRARVGAHRWTESLVRATYRKELRLILRTPMLFVQVLSTIGPMLPLWFIRRTVDADAIAGLAVVLAQLGAAPFIASATSMENGWDLVRASPTPELRLRLAKLAAALTLPLGAAAAVCLGLTLWGRPGLATVTLAVACIGSVAIGWISVSRFRPQFGRTIKPKFDATDLGRMLLGLLVFFPSVGGIWAFGAEKYLLAAGLLGGVTLVSVLIVAFTQLREVPEAEIDAARAAAAVSSK
jgi:ABC-2 type transport system permease protein